MTPCTLFRFSKQKVLLRGKRFEAMAAVKENSTKVLKAISTYEKCFEDNLKRWNKCVACNGDYCEEVKINVGQRSWHSS